MTTVAIVGAGDIGGATAQALTRSDRIDRVLLVDPRGDAAAGKALDIQQAGAVDRFHTRLDGTGDETRLIGCGVCVIADRLGPDGGEWRGEEALAMLVRIAAGIGTAPIVLAGADQLDLLLTAARETSLPRERLLGSCPEALAASIRAIVALEARCSPSEVALTVLGRPPAGFVVPWTEASIGGYALSRVLSQAQLARIEARAGQLWPPGPTTLGTAAAVVATAILAASRRTFSLLTPLDGEFGIRHTVGALPVRLGDGGIVERKVPFLGEREQVRLQTTLHG